MEEKQENQPFTEINERLKSGEFIYEPHIREKIRKAYEGEKVIVVDVDGVLRSSENKNETNPRAESVLKNLKDNGYHLILWTNALRKTLESLPSEVLSQFELTITYENYTRKMQYDWQNQILEGDFGTYVNTVENTSWLNSEDKKTFLIITI